MTGQQCEEEEEGEKEEPRRQTQNPPHHPQMRKETMPIWIPSWMQRRQRISAENDAHQRQELHYLDWQQWTMRVVDAGVTGRGVHERGAFG